MSTNLRALTAKCIFAVVDKGRSLGDELPKQLEKVSGKDKGLLQELCYGVLRYLPELEFDTQAFINKPLKGKQRVFHFLILVGIYQIKYTRIPDHAAVGETVAGASALKNRHLKGMINGVLRSFQRSLKEKPPHTNKPLPDAIAYNHPSWFIKKVQAAYPEEWQNILAANMERPPMWLRVNQLHHTVDEYVNLLNQQGIEIELIDSTSSALKLKQAIDVNTLPGFNEGHVSVQDAAAQQAAILLDAQPQDKVLDCCAAPGGKTCHIMESQPALEQMTAIDVEANRLTRVHENLTRLNLKANVICGDATQPQAWWDGEYYDRILLDVPCSATGVIRRHPDIKWLRKAEDITALHSLQQEILESIWGLLKPGGTLIYATCSILPEENKDQVTRFLAQHPDATHIALTDNPEDIGWQILPNEASMDGFYYAKLLKSKD